MSTYPSTLATIPKQRVDVYWKANWDDVWALVPHLVAERFVLSAAPGISHAQLRWVYGLERRQGETVPTAVVPVNLQGGFVRISFPAAVLGDRRDVWHGWVPDEAFAIHRSIRLVGSYAPMGDQMLEAYGMEAVLDTVRLDRAYGINQIETHAAAFPWVPRFNVRTEHDEEAEWGNRTYAKTDDGCYAFTASPNVAECVWTNRQAIEYLLTFFPQNTDACTAMVWTLHDPCGCLDTITPGISLDGLTLREALNVLIDRRRGHTWCVRVFESPVPYCQIHVFPLFDVAVTVGGTTLAPNTDAHTLLVDTSRNLTRCVFTSRHSSHATRITVRGQRLKICFSVDRTMSAFEAAWDAALQAEYLAPTGVADATGRDAVRRSDNRYRRVFCRFRMNTVTWDGLDRLGTLVIPEVVPVSGGVILGGVADGPFWAGQKRFLSWLPMVDASDESGTKLVPLMVLARQPYDKSTGINAKYVDLRRGYRDPAMEVCPPVGIQPLSNDMGFQLGSHGHDWMPHVMGLAKFSAAADKSNVEPVYDYDKIIATVCFEADDVLRIVVDTAFGVGYTGPRRELVIDVPDAEFWAIAPHTVDGLLADGTLSRTAVTWTVVRDDYAMLQRVAALAKSWYAKPRYTIDAQLAYLEDFPVGYVVVASDEGRLFGQINTVCTAVEWDGIAHTTAIRTGFVELDALNVALEIHPFPSSRYLGQHIAALGREIQNVTKEIDNSSSEDDG